jgi:hypothetical protein
MGFLTLGGELARNWTPDAVRALGWPLVIIICVTVVLVFLCKALARKWSYCPRCGSRKDVS